MDPFPEDAELVALFESEPRTLDKGIGWYYDQLRFDLTRGDEAVECVIEAASGEFQVRWSAGERTLFWADLKDVTGLTVVREGDNESLLLTRRGDQILQLLLSPKIGVSWRTPPRN